MPVKISFKPVDPDTLSFRVVDSPLGPLVLAASPDGLVGLSFSRSQKIRPGSAAGKSPHLAKAERELKAYFAGTLRTFSVPIHLPDALTPFGRKVYAACARIKFGRVVSYKDLAAMAGRPAAARAAGSYMARNPVALFIPCHRIIASNHIGGYGPGLDYKVALLEHEGVLHCCEECGCEGRG
jgi:methylated-DNA-[protein]-cysteine S-methyltransferase